MNIRRVVKVAGTVVFLVVFAFSYKGTQTRVRPSEVLFPSVSVTTTTAQPPTTTVMLATTTTVSMRKPPQPLPTVVEPWVTMSTTTMKVVLASYEPRTELERLICDPKWEWDCQEAIAVATCESNMNPNAVSKPNTNGTIDRGLFQMNDVWEVAWPPEVWDRILIARTNIAMAHHAWKVGNDSWLYWACQP